LLGITRILNKSSDEQRNKIEINIKNNHFIFGMGEWRIKKLGSSKYFENLQKFNQPTFEAKLPYNNVVEGHGRI